MRFRFQLAFPSFVKFTSIVGLCFGVCFIPILILLNLRNVESVTLPFFTVSTLSIISSPLAYTIAGGLWGLLVIPYTDGYRLK